MNKKFIFYSVLVVAVVVASVVAHFFWPAGAMITAFLLGLCFWRGFTWTSVANAAGGFNDQPRHWLWRGFCGLILVGLLLGGAGLIAADKFSDEIAGCWYKWIGDHENHVQCQIKDLEKILADLKVNQQSLLDEEKVEKPEDLKDRTTFDSYQTEIDKIEREKLPAKKTELEKIMKDKATALAQGKAERHKGILEMAVEKARSILPNGDQGQLTAQHKARLVAEVRAEIGRLYEKAKLATKDEVTKLKDDLKNATRRLEGQQCFSFSTEIEESQQVKEVAVVIAEVSVFDGGVKGVTISPASLSDCDTLQGKLDELKTKRDQLKRAVDVLEAKVQDFQGSHPASKLGPVLQDLEKLSEKLKGVEKKLNDLGDELTQKRVKLSRKEDLDRLQSGITAYCSIDIAAVCSDAAACDGRIVAVGQKQRSLDNYKADFPVEVKASNQLLEQHKQNVTARKKQLESLAKLSDCERDLTGFPARIGGLKDATECVSKLDDLRALLSTVRSLREFDPARADSLIRDLEDKIRQVEKKKTDFEAEARKKAEKEHSRLERERQEREGQEQLARQRAEEEAARLARARGASEARESLPPERSESRPVASSAPEVDDSTYGYWCVQVPGVDPDDLKKQPIEPVLLCFKDEDDRYFPVGSSLKDSRLRDLRDCLVRNPQDGANFKIRPTARRKGQVSVTFEGVISLREDLARLAFPEAMKDGSKLYVVTELWAEQSGDKKWLPMELTFRPPSSK